MPGGLSSPRDDRVASPPSKLSDWRPAESREERRAARMMFKLRTRVVQTMGFVALLVAGAATFYFRRAQLLNDYQVFVRRVAVAIGVGPRFSTRREALWASGERQKNMARSVKNCCLTPLSQVLILILVS